MNKVIQIKNSSVKFKEKIMQKEIIEKLMLGFLMLQPLLDLYFLFDESVVNFFGFSPSTIIRIGFVGIIGILFLFVLRNKKEICIYIVYLGLITVYIILHHINALNFTDFYDGYDFGYTLISELFYVIRMLMPLFLIIVSCHYQFSTKRIEMLVSVLIILISGSIIVTNILGISTGSYSKEVIKGNIFCWFMEDKCNLSYMDLASKGLFLDPNRLSALLVLLTPLTFYVMFKNPTIKNKLVIVINMIGMLMLGTKVSTFGFVIILILSLLIYVFFSFIKREIKFRHNIFWYLVVVLVGYCLIFPYSPAINRTNVDNSIFENYNANIDNRLEENEKNLHELNDKINGEDELDEREKYMMEFIEQNYLDYSLHYDFVFQCYPYYYDPEFWYNVMEMSIEERTNFRNLERMMLERVKEKNDNKWDEYFGITFTRMGNIFDLERDFISHYYTMGIIGMILLVLPYIIIILICIIRMLITHKNNLNMKNVFFLMGIGITLFAAYFTGNVLDGLIVTLILGFCIGQLINGVFNITNASETC